MAVLAVPMDKTFEVAVDKVENFDKKAKEHSGKHLLQDRLKKHNKGDVEWDLKKYCLLYTSPSPRDRV